MIALLARASVCALPKNRSPRRKWPCGIRHPPLISFNNLALEHLYPHFIPHPRACSSSRPRLTARPRTPPRGRPGGLVAIGMEGSGRGPPTLIFPCDFFWSAENVGTGCDHCADWADQASVSSGVSSSSGRTFHRVWVCRLTREAQSQSRLAWALSSTSRTGPCKADLRYGRSSASSLSSFARSAVAFRKHSLAVILAAEPPSGSA